MSDLCDVFELVLYGEIAKTNFGGIMKKIAIKKKARLIAGLPQIDFEVEMISTSLP